LPLIRFNFNSIVILWKLSNYLTCSWSL